MSKEKLLELRKEMKARKPEFVRQQGHYKDKLTKKWRQPKGMHSKLRRKFGGKLSHPSMGYSSPKAVRGLHRSGLKPVNVRNEKDLEGLKSSEHGVILSDIGQKKKLELVKKIIGLKLKILNLRKSPEDYVKTVEEELVKKKEESKKKSEKKKKSKEESVKKAEEKKKKEEEKTEEKQESPEKKEAKTEKKEISESVKKVEDKKEKEEKEKRKVLEQK